MPKEADIRHGRHVVHARQVHLVLVTTYRRRAITARTRTILLGACAAVCGDVGATRIAADGEEDHRHVLVAYPPAVAISRLVNSLKGVSARRVRAANLPEVRKVRWGDHVWSPSDVAATTGGANLATVKAYVDAQRTPGRKKTGPKPRSR